MQGAKEECLSRQVSGLSAGLGECRLRSAGCSARAAVLSQWVEGVSLEGSNPITLWTHLGLVKIWEEEISEVKLRKQPLTGNSDD